MERKSMSRSRTSSPSPARVVADRHGVGEVARAGRPPSPQKNSAYASATRCGRAPGPAALGSSPMASRISCTAASMRAVSIAAMAPLLIGARRDAVAVAGSGARARAPRSARRRPRRPSPLRRRRRPGRSAPSGRERRSAAGPTPGGLSLESHCGRSGSFLTSLKISASWTWSSVSFSSSSAASRSRMSRLSLSTCHASSCACSMSARTSASTCLGELARSSRAGGPCRGRGRPRPATGRA